MTVALSVTSLSMLVIWDAVSLMYRQCNDHGPQCDILVDAGDLRRPVANVSSL